MIVIIILYILLGILFVDKEELIRINESLQQPVGSIRGSIVTYGTSVIIFLIIPIIILVIYCIRKIKEKK